MNDELWMNKAKEARESSRCKKKQLGCALVLFPEPGEVLSPYTPGYNGPPELLPVCDQCRRPEDLKNWDSHEYCPAVHAEQHAIFATSREGYSTDGAVLYSYMGVPCKDCMIDLIDAGISEIVVLIERYYDELSKEILKEWISKGGIFRVYNPD